MAKKKTIEAKATKRAKPVKFDATAFDFGYNVGRSRRSRKLTKSQRYFANSRGGSGE